MYTLAKRSAIAAVDGARVDETGFLLPQGPTSIVATLVVSSTGAPASYALRAAIEASQDGTNWYQVCRFVDVTADGAQLLRAGSAAAVTLTAVATADMTAAAAAAILVDCPWPKWVRATTKLQTLTGGIAPAITATILMDLGSD